MAFLMCVVSAVVAGLVILAAVVTEIVFYYTNSEWLVLWSTAANKTVELSSTMLETMPSQAFNETFAMNETSIAASILNATETLLEDTVIPEIAAGGISLHDTVFLCFIAVLGILAAVSVGLLLHLCFFHVYISFLGLTTYEYIRSQRQQNIPSTQPMPPMAPETTLNALKKSATQLYFCSSIDPKNLVENHNSSAKYRPKSLHCCDRSLEYHKTSHKAFYMCSVLQERTSPMSGVGSAAAINPLANKRTCQTRTFHCCSEFKQVVRTPPTSSGTPSDSSDYSQRRDEPTESMANHYVQYSEQCTFCSFKIKASSKPNELRLPPGDPTDRQRCCTKTMTKHHRWKRKWNCCSNVPDSPDVPADVLRTVSGSVTDSYEHQLHPNGAKNLNYSLKNSIKPVQNAKGGANNNFRPSLSTNLKNGRSRLVRPWPLARFRHMFRMIGRCRQPASCRNEATNVHQPPPIAGNVKQNQVRPLAVADPPKHMTPITTCQTVLPTSIIRGGGSAGSKNDLCHSGGVSVPALPPPTRRKIRNTTDLDDLAESLTFVQQQPLRHNGMSNGRRRRKNNLLRTRSPTLSPIHESGYSNPTSPQPCRHHNKVKTIINPTSSNTSSTA